MKLIRNKQRISHTFTIGGTVAVPSGDIDYVPPMFASVAPGQVCNLIKVRYRINSGTSATIKIQKNAVDTQYASLSATTTSTTTTGIGAPTPILDEDTLALVVTAVSGTPKNLTCTMVLEYS